MNIIFFIHVFLFVSALLVPFMNNEPALELYSLVVPFLFFHWAVNDDTCALTQLEMYATGNEKEQTFFGRLVGPVYTMSDGDADKIVKGLLFILWLMVQCRLDRVPGLNKIRTLYT
jgi:hypothetical protein